MIKLYSTGCPKCKVLEAKLKQKNIEYEVEKDPAAIIAKGQEVNILSAPILEVENKYYDFAKAIKYVNERI